MTRRDRIIVGLLATGGVLAAVPGVHAFEVFLGALPAKVASHGVALALLAAALWQWRVRRRAAPPPGQGAA